MSCHSCGNMNGVHLATHHRIVRRQSSGMLSGGFWEAKQGGFRFSGAPGERQGVEGGLAGAAFAEEPVAGDQAGDGALGGVGGNTGAGGDFCEGESALLVVVLDRFEEDEVAEEIVVREGFEPLAARDAEPVKGTVLHKTPDPVRRRAYSRMVRLKIKVGKGKGWKEAGQQSEVRLASLCVGSWNERIDSTPKRGFCKARIILWCR